VRESRRPVFTNNAENSMKREVKKAELDAAAGDPTIASSAADTKLYSNPTLAERGQRVVLETAAVEDDEQPPETLGSKAASRGRVADSLTSNADGTTKRPRRAKKKAAKATKR
jgi:hypothetical protein